MVYRSWRCTSIPGWDLDYFTSKEWLDVQDRLDELEAQGVLYCPDRSDLFRSLALVEYSKCNVVLLGQDPYPNRRHATGVAFSAERPNLHQNDTGKSESFERSYGSKLAKIEHFNKLPASLKIIYKELMRDLLISLPGHGCLENWCEQGVLLWNATPTCNEGEPGSHQDWYEWMPLTTEIVERLSAKGKVIFVLIGHRAQIYANCIDEYNNTIIYTSHPSPRGQIKAKNKFIGSRLFSTINDKLNHYLKEPIDWRL